MMKTVALLAALVIVPILPARGLAAGDTAESVEKELGAILKEMDALQSELDRIDDFARAPKATVLRLEIGGDGNVAPPSAARILVAGRVEGEREWGKAEREVFSGGAVPLVANIPFLPGRYAARIELTGPAWKTPPAVEVPLEIRPGETAAVKLRLVAAPGKGTPALRPAEAGSR